MEKKKNEKKKQTGKNFATGDESLLFISINGSAPISIKSLLLAFKFSMKKQNH